jgi:hypothetical protein
LEKAMANLPSLRQLRHLNMWSKAFEFVLGQPYTAALGQGSDEVDQRVAPGWLTVGGGIHFGAQIGGKPNSEESQHDRRPKRKTICISNLSAKNA